MLKTRNRKLGLLAILLAVVMAFTVLPELPRLTLATDEAEVIASGECGDNATWALDEDGVLTISGTGEMEDYSPYTSPWYDYRTSITKTIVESGITHIGNASFCNSYMTEISLPDGLESIGEYAFTGSKLINLEIPESVAEIGENVAYVCRSLETVKFPSGLETVPRWAFSGCTSLAEITLPENLVTIDDYAFDDCTSLASVIIPASVTFIGVEAFPDTTEVQYPSNLSKIEDGSYKLVDTVYVTGTLNYEYAYEVLELVNEEREAEGLDSLTMDTELLEAAMQRAAEISLLYDHTRPCGLNSSSISLRVRGENLYAGPTTPTAAMTGWMDSYWHMSNIIGSGYQSIGIGCFYSNGHYYWAQIFASDEATELTQPENSTETMSVMIDPDLFQDYLNFSKTSVSIDPGETTSVTATITNQEWTAYSVKLEPESFTWTSSDTTIAMVDASGQITGISPGTATITAATMTTGELYRTVEVTVTGIDISGCTLSLSESTFTYDGTAKTPSVTVKDGSTTLAEGTDYTVSYSDNTDAGRATVTVTGIGNYSGTATVRFTISKADQTVAATAGSSSISVGETTTVSVSGAAGNVTYASSDTGVATVDSSGTVTGVGAGTATITATAAGTDNYNAASDSVEITVTGSGSGDDDGNGNNDDDDNGNGNDDPGDPGSGDDTGTSGDTLMVRRGNTMYFNYTLKGGNADFSTNAGRSTDQVLVGDWDGDGVDTICLRRGNVCYFIDDITTMHGKRLIGRI